LYALSRHLLKFQAIYPPEPPIVGHVRNEPVYLREYVHELNGRENWLKEARVVKMGEKWYKQVKARPRFDRVSSLLNIINLILLIIIYVTEWRANRSSTIRIVWLLAN